MSTALALAHALLAGPRQLDGMLARAVATLGAQPAWLEATCRALLDALLLAPWDLITAPQLAHRVLREAGFQAACDNGRLPAVRRYILRPQRMGLLPLGLEHCALPVLTGAGDLAAWLGLAPDELDWFTACPPRRRRAALDRQHYRGRWWPKPGGGVRLLEVPRPRLMALQRRVLHGLLDRLPVHEAAHGFVAGHGVLDHAACHAGQAVLLHFDLQDFFGSVPARRVHALLATLGYPPSVCRGLTTLLTSRVPEPVLQRLCDEGLMDPAHARRLRSAHLPQGAPASPALANLCAFGLDLRLDGLAHVLGARYSRYADDLVLSGPAGLRGRATALEVQVAAIARDEGFRINHRKTRVGTQAGAQRVCGIIVNQRPNLPRCQFDGLKALLHRCARDGPAAHNQPPRPDFRAHVLGRVAWATQVNPAKAARLHRLLAQVDWAR